MAMINQYEKQGRLTPREAMDWRERIVIAKDPALLELPAPAGQNPKQPIKSDPGLPPDTVAPGSGQLAPNYSGADIMGRYGSGGMMGGYGGGGGMMGY